MKKQILISIFIVNSITITIFKKDANNVLSDYLVLTNSISNILDAEILAKSDNPDSTFSFSRVILVKVQLSGSRGQNNNFMTQFSLVYLYKPIFRPYISPIKSCMHSSSEVPPF